MTGIRNYPPMILTSDWNSLVTFLGGATGNAGFSLGSTDVTPADPTGTTSTTGVMMGLAVYFTPVRSGIIMVQVEGQMQNNTTGDGAVAKLYYGTSTAPANGTAATGTQKGKQAQMDAFPTAAKKWPFGITTIITGLPLNTAVWLDLLLAAITGGTANLNNLEIVVSEI